MSEMAADAWTIEPRSTGIAARAREIWAYRHMVVFFGRRAFQKLYMKHLIPLAARFLARRGAPVDMMRYYWAMIEECVPPATILACLEAASFTEVRRTTTYVALSDYLGIVA